MAGKASVPGRGRKPKPNSKKELAGNPGKRALNTQEPKYSPITNVDPPEWLDETAQTMWQMLVPELCRERVLAITDLHNVEIFCAAYSRWRQAERELATSSLTIEGAMGGKIKNPLITVINEAKRQIAQFGALLGLDPSSRSRIIGGGGGHKPSNKFSEFTGN